MRGDSSYLRRINSVAVLRALHAGSSFTISALAKAAGVSRPTCEEAINELLAQGWAAEAHIDQTGPRRPGRPARRVRFRAEAAYVAGLDIGAHKVLTLLTDLSGTVVASCRATVQPDFSAEERLAVARKTVTGALAAAPGEGHPSLLAVVVGTPGVVDAEGKAFAPTVMPEWNGLPLGDRARRFFGTLARDGTRTWTGVENDMNLAALAEHWWGAARGVDDVVYLHAGYRMGAAVLIGGRPHRGRHGAAGEIGTLSVLNWVDAYRQLLSYDPPNGGTAEQVERIFAAASGKDRRASALVENFARGMADGLAAMVLSVDPELVVLGGGISQAGAALLDPVRGHLEPQCPFPPRVVTSTLGDEAVALGAVRLCLDHVEKELFDADSHPADAPRREADVAPL
ncbi:ROK family protein [Streptomyces sp. RKAG293]|uniref:ROK family transcriptional regulator n=1 Tax=Streptomyces sp. RKAG293 TaxID=2893403 RepID=UPI0020339442|nr:ROK family protein [Streptomyces sp. RKAG293]MCM2423246.1 ROK family protein [Streptomyces sp. RKAG293]